MLRMAEPASTPPTAEFQLDPTSASKRPDQLVSVLTRTLRQEFPEVFERLGISHDADTALVSILHLDELDAATATEVSARARTAYNDFITSPWY